MTTSTRYKLAVALLLTLALVAVEAAVRAWKWSAAPPARAPASRPGLVKARPAPGMAAPPRPTPSVGWIGPTSIDFAKVGTLAAALELVRRELIQGGKADLAALVTEDRVCKALRTGAAAYEAFLTRAKNEGVQDYGLREYFLDKIKPRLLKIAQDRTWSPDCNFNAFFGVGTRVEGKRIDYDGFWLRLEITPKRSKQGPDSFTMPIISMGFGDVRY